MAADWGLYSALRTRDDWQTKRADAQMNMAATQQHRADLEKDVEQRQAYHAKIAEMTDTLANMDVLPEDQERVRQVEKDSRRKIYEGLNKYNGDPKRFMSAGGVSTLMDYKNSVLQSTQVKEAINNKASLAMYLDAAKSGKYIKPIQMESVEVDPATGQEITVPKNVPWEEQYRMYKKGEITSLMFNGAEDVIDIKAEDFWDSPKNAYDAYSPDNIVTVSQVIEKALFKGASQEQANDIGRTYENILNRGGQVWRWGGKDAQELSLKLQQNEREWQRLGLDKEELALKRQQAKAAEEAAQIGNQWATQFESMADGEYKAAGVDEPTKKILNNIANLSPATEEAVGDIPVGSKSKFDTTKKYYFQDGSEVDPTLVENSFALGNPTGYLKINGVPHLEFRAIADDDVEMPGITETYLGVWDQLSPEGQDRGWSSNTGIMDGTVSGTIYMSLEDIINNPVILQGINKQLGYINSKHELTAPSIGDQDQLRMLKEAAARAGIPFEQFIQGMIDANQK